MKILSRFAQTIDQTLRRVLRRGQPRDVAAEQTRDTSESYHGLFDGVVESASGTGHGGPASANPRAETAPRFTAKASGFVRIEVDRQKKATGAFMFFTEGEILTGTLEGSRSRRGCVVDAKFQTSAVRPADPSACRAIPTVATGRLKMASVRPRPRTQTEDGSSCGDDQLTIRFVHTGA